MALNEKTVALNSSVQSMIEKDALIAELEQRLKAQEKITNDKETENKKLKDQVDKFEDEFYARLNHYDKVKALVSLKILINN